MAKFGYDTVKKMSPRGNNRYSTDYYKQSRSERDRVRQHIVDVIEQFGEQVIENPLYADALLEPMTGYPRTNHEPNYSALDIVEDIYTQLREGRDIPSGMLGRWNRLFDGTGKEIEMEQHYDPETNRFNQIFSNHQ